MLLSIFVFASLISLSLLYTFKLSQLNLKYVDSWFKWWLFAQTYCAGDQISSTHQNKEYVVGAGYGDYETGDIFKFSDLNGDLNCSF